MAIDYEALFGGDSYNPCDALKTLRPVYMKLRVEGTIQRVTFRDRTVEMKGADVNELASLIRTLESECAAKQGRSNRFAITAGARRA